MNGKNIILACLATVLAAACSKAPAGDTTGDETVYGEPIPVTIEVGIGKEDPETRMAYTLSGNTLKSSWNKGDQISLVTYDLNYKLMTNDILTAEASGTSVKFKGTYSCPEQIGSSIRVGVTIIYPALSGEPLATPPEPALSNGYYTSGPYYIQDRLLNLDADRKFIQYSDGNLVNLPYYTFMEGNVDRDTFLATGKFTTTLQHKTYIIKAELQLPSIHPDGNSDYLITSVKVETKRPSPAIPTGLRGYGSMGFLRTVFAYTKSDLQTYLGKIRSDGVAMGINCPRNSKITVYFIGGLADEKPYILRDDDLEITICHLDENLEEKTLTVTRSVQHSVKISYGVMYTMSADFNYADGLIDIKTSGLDISFNNPFDDTQIQI